MTALHCLLLCFPMLFVSVAGTLDFSQPFLSNPHVQRYRRQQLWPQSPRNLYHLRQLYQDAETRCTLRLWRLSRRGELDCEKDEDCTKEYGSDVYCRELQVCKLTKGNVCWLKQPDGIECSGDSACLSGHCDSDLGICTHRPYHVSEGDTTPGGTEYTTDAAGYGGGGRYYT
ncbi:uncharacterized protein LOC122374587 [Amphibalanus amphitrite]|uniref:uncharacterized protein LOC122374587 n=1 Tax=Amphibalanus amphitrite TaxID=1232801 RepID=UPI001C90B60D|nr:uncharacterized protein LOC122374587 [Amphibalanus amphitrite]